MPHQISQNLAKFASVLCLDNNEVPLKRSLVGTVPRLPLHVGFDSLTNLQTKLLAEGYEHTIILADFVHLLENCSPELSQQITEYYLAFFDLLGLGGAKKILTSEYQQSDYFWEIVFKLAKNFTARELEKALIQDMREAAICKVSDELHIVFQTADIVYFQAGLVVGNTSQKRIYDTARKVLRKSNLLPPGELLVNLPLDLQGNSLKESRSHTRISYHESESSLERKVNSIQNDRLDVMEELFKHSVIPYVQNVKCQSVRIAEQSLPEALTSVNPTDLKACLTESLNKRFSVYRTFFDENPDLISWINLSKVRGD